MFLIEKSVWQAQLLFGTEVFWHRRNLKKNQKTVSMFPVEEKVVFESYGYLFGYFWHSIFDEKFHNRVLSHIQHTLLFLNLEQGADLAVPGLLHDI